MKRKHFLCLILCFLGTASAFADEDVKAQLAAKAGSILERNCLQCHRGDGSASKSKFDVRDVQSMIDTGVVVPEDAESSMLWLLAHRGTMPPRSQPQLSRLIAADSQIVADWIKEGAREFPKPPVRPVVTLQATLKAIAADLRKLPDNRVRSRQRYFTLSHAHNNPAVGEDSLLLSLAGLAKALNSLSWKPEIAAVRVVDDQNDLQTHGTLFAVDLDHIGWTTEHWRAVRARYPYTIGFANLEDRTLENLEKELLDLTDGREGLYLIRADWFVTTAMQPQLYHALLYDLTLPELTQRLVDKSRPANPKGMIALDLERYLGVDVVENILLGNENAMRCGFTPSGVSGQNRLLERHRTKFGAYWKSYDFKAGNRRSILSQFPLGPDFPGNESRLAFDHDGGEIIFNLPNGLQAYLLVDGEDHRIDAGPIEVVSDALKTSGSPAIVNGLSCMSCHKEGMIDPPEDEIRDFASVVGKDRERVQKLYPPREVLEPRILEDALRYQKALDATIGSIMKSGDHHARNYGELPEPVSEVARNYLLEELDLRAVAAELHEPDVTRLQAKIENDNLLRELGIGVLLRPDGKIKRAFWESSMGGTSIMQLTAFALNYSTPQFNE